MKERRELAFYKESEEPWTNEEYMTICEYVGDNFTPLEGVQKHRQYIYDQGGVNEFMFPWTDQTILNCRKISYESIFGTEIYSPSTELPIDVEDIKDKFMKLIDKRNKANKKLREFAKKYGLEDLI